MKLKKEAVLTCPKCKAKHKEKMPTDACLHFYKCSNCGEMLKPKKGDCCVFCSYADTKCPSEQMKLLRARAGAASPRASSGAKSLRSGN